MMLWQPQGCCCFSRRTGSLILGSITLAGSIFGMLILANIYMNHDHNVEKEIQKFCQERLEAEDMAACIDSAKNFVMVGGAVIVLIYVIQATFSSLLMYGISRNNPCLMIPYMVLRLIFIILGIVIGAAITIGLIVANEIGLMLILVVIKACFIFLETYFLLVVRAHYIQMKKDSGYAHVELQEEGQFTSMGDMKNGGTGEY